MIFILHPKVRLLCFAVLFSALSVVTLPQPAESLTLKTFTIDGVVTYSETSLIPLDSPFVGSFSIDFDAPLVHMDNSFSVYEGLWDFNVSMNGYVYQASSPHYIVVTDTGINVTDTYGLFLGHASNWSFYFSSPLPFPDHSLANAYDLDQWSSSNFLGLQIYGMGDQYVTEVYGVFNTTSSTPVPEPSTFLLLGSGLAGIGFYTRKRKKA